VLIVASRFLNYLLADFTNTDVKIEPYFQTNKTFN